MFLSFLFCLVLPLNSDTPFLFPIPFFFFLQLCHLLRLSILSFYKLKALLLFLSWRSPKLQNIPFVPSTDSQTLSLSKDILWLSFRFSFVVPASQQERKKERKKQRKRLTSNLVPFLFLLLYRLVKDFTVWAFCRSSLVFLSSRKFLCKFFFSAHTSVLSSFSLSLLFLWSLFVAFPSQASSLLQFFPG